MRPSFVFYLVTFSSALLIPAVGILEAAPEKRSFRTIVPIKQTVPPGTTGMKTQSVSVKIPPPPVPQIQSSLFPNDSVPETDIFPEAIEVPIENGTEENVDIAKEEQTIDEKDTDGPTLYRLREEAHLLADRGLKYKFGEDDPDDGGLDCSSTMQYLLTKIGIEDVPRTSYDQYYWLRNKKLVRDVSGKNASKKLFQKLSPGDLIFWGGTWKSGHKVSHVMIYMGYDEEADKHYVFGARGKSSKGLLGNGVDIFELEPNRGRLVAHGKVPGLIYPD